MQLKRPPKGRKEECLRILDMTAGNRGIWFDKRNPFATFLDMREEVKPDIVCDIRDIPAPAGSDFDLVVFDPPHMNTGKSTKHRIAQYYGRFTTAHINDTIAGAAKEAHRLTRQDALMAFKWNTHGQKLEKVLAMMAAWWEPLFGHKVSMRTKHSSTTHWVMLRRLPT